MTKPKPKPSELPDVLAENVRAARMAAGITQGALALRMSELGFDWSQVTVAQVEGSRRRRISLEEWLGLAVALAGRSPVPALDLLKPNSSRLVTVGNLPNLTSEDVTAIVNYGSLATGRRGDEARQLQEVARRRRQELEQDIEAKEAELAKVDARLAELEAEGQK